MPPTYRFIDTGRTPYFHVKRTPTTGRKTIVPHQTDPNGFFIMFYWSRTTLVHFPFKPFNDYIMQCSCRRSPEDTKGKQMSLARFTVAPLEKTYSLSLVMLRKFRKTWNISPESMLSAQVSSWRWSRLLNGCAMWTMLPKHPQTLRQRRSSRVHQLGQKKS